MSKITAIILDKDGVFVDFHKLWLRVIAYRAQLIAEMSTSSWDQFNKVRTSCIRAMGIDEEEETIDVYAPCSMPASDVKLALKVASFLTINEWDPSFNFKKASNIVEEAFTLSQEQLSVVELSEAISGSIPKIQEISKQGFKIGVFSSDSSSNIQNCLDKFGISSLVSVIQGDQFKSTELYEDLCSRLGVNPSETLMVSDLPHDLEIARAAGAMTIGVLSGVVSPENIGLLKIVADDVLNSLADLNLSKLGGNKKKAKT